jgi:hypothetical protein
MTRAQIAARALSVMFRAGWELRGFWARDEHRGARRLHAERVRCLVEDALALVSSYVPPIVAHTHPVIQLRRRAEELGIIERPPREEYFAGVSPAVPPPNGSWSNEVDS